MLAKFERCSLITKLTCENNNEVSELNSRQENMGEIFNRHIIIAYTSGVIEKLRILGLYNKINIYVKDM